MKQRILVLAKKKKFSIPASILLIFFCWFGWSVGSVLTAPGTDTISARLAEWGRDHYLGRVITFAEIVQYKLHPPKQGGVPDPNQLNNLKDNAGLNGQAIAPIVLPALQGEGEFKTVVSQGIKPIIQVAYLRPDKVHTSFLSGVALMSGNDLKFVLHPGFAEPGKLENYVTQDLITKANRSGLVATFNSGFKLKDSHGGYYSEGITARPLAKDAASFVIYSDGHANIGSWGSEVSMTPDVVSVRQNLVLLVDQGVMSPAINKNFLINWGFTIKNAYYVWRSGVGITATGDYVYVAGDALSVESLANLLQKAGAVRAMELDINPYLVSYMWYSHMGEPTKLVNFKRPANRFFLPSSRDFFAIYSR